MTELSQPRAQDRSVDRRDVRRIATVTIAVLYAAGTAIASFGLPSLLTAWTTSGDEIGMRTHYVVWGLLAGVLLPAMALPLVRRPLVAPAQQLAAFVVAAVVALAFAFEPENARYTFFFAAPALALVLLHPARRRLFSEGAWDPFMLAVAALGAVPAGLYAFENLRMSASTHYLNPMHGEYQHNGLFAIALVLSVVVAARRASGWGWVAGSTTLCVAVLGFAGLVFPTDPGSPGTTGGVIALALAVLLVAASTRPISSERRTS